MQTSLSSLRISSHLGRFRNSRAFTLIELLISAAIITIITSIVLVRFTAFDSTILLKSLAYEVATSVREAQIYSVSVINTSGGNFRYPYGLSFSPGNTSYIFFRFANTSTAVRPYNDLSEPNPDVAEVIRTLTLNSGMEIYRICIKQTSSASEACRTSAQGGVLDISFRRPEFSAIFNASWLAANQQDTIEYARIEVRSTRNTTNVWTVEVKLLGQISVYKM
jgi:prepilin-type N-terminal cleavage/methylation domain-containing protein